MTSTDAVKNEIERFLKSSDPEVLCITGEWGVGKTYTWQTILDRLRARREIGLSRYSYVSLFGVASLEALKLSIFENLEFLVPQGGSGFEWMLSGGNTLLHHSKKLVGVAAALPKVGDAISKAHWPGIGHCSGRYRCRPKGLPIGAEFLGLDWARSEAALQWGQEQAWRDQQAR